MIRTVVIFVTKPRHRQQTPIQKKIIHLVPKEIPSSARPRRNPNSNREGGVKPVTDTIRGKPQSKSNQQTARGNDTYGGWESAFGSRHHVQAPGAESLREEFLRRRWPVSPRSHRQPPSSPRTRSRKLARGILRRWPVNPKR